MCPRSPSVPYETISTPAPPCSTTIPTPHRYNHFSFSPVHQPIKSENVKGSSNRKKTKLGQNRLLALEDVGSFLPSRVSVWQDLTTIRTHRRTPNQLKHSMAIRCEFVFYLLVVLMNLYIICYTLDVHTVRMAPGFRFGERGPKWQRSCGEHGAVAKAEGIIIVHEAIN